MLRFFLLLFLCASLFPTKASAQESFLLGCEEVERIEIWRIRGEVWHARPVDGYSYALLFFLNNDAAQRFGRIYRATEETPVDVDGSTLPTRLLKLKTSSGPLTSAAPHFDRFRDGVLSITKKSAAHAFAAARAVCPEKAPRELLTDGS
ncbi:MAG: hypothetical protein AB7D51_00525 [Desulfovibrionaceae bacterium]